MIASNHRAGPTQGRLRRLAAAASFYARSPQNVVRALRGYYATAGVPRESRPESLLPLDSQAAPGGRQLWHVGLFTRGNVGDYLLPIAVRDLFDRAGGRSEWTLRQAHPVFESADAGAVNRGSGMVIGGGGLFLRDTNPNANSGWQWNCPIEHLKAITTPMVVFAVGYNRFRGQDEFHPVFKEHLSLLAGKCVFMGLRNRGSIAAIRSYLPEDLREKVRYQPCPTTLLAKLYPQLTTMPARSAGSSRPVVGINAAFDRAELRFGGRELAVLTSIARALAALSAEADIHLIVHCEEDAHLMPFLRGSGVPFQRKDLRRASGEDVIRYYSGIQLVIGMRGHAQMIPFGCGTPVISLISHDKVRWFLEDIQRQDWGLEILDPDLTDRLVAKSRQMLENAEAVTGDIRRIREELWEVSTTNALDATAAFDRHTRRA